MSRRPSSDDNRISDWDYQEAILGIQTQFELIRFGLQFLPKSRIGAFFRSRINQEMAAAERAWTQIFTEMPELADDLKPELLAAERKKLRRRYKTKDIRVRKEVSEDRLNQSELLLLVAHFESFMKVIHETFLKAAPHKVFGKMFRGKPNAELSISSLFDSTQNHWDSRKFVAEMIYKEVKWLDNQSIEHRAGYFAEHFTVSYGSADAIKQLKEIFDLRNQISHQAYSAPPKNLDEIKEQPLVSGDTLNGARRFFTWIPKGCVEVGAKTYPSYFRQH